MSGATGGTALTLALDAGQEIRPGETVTVSYTPTGANPLQDSGGNQTPAFAGLPVANGLAAAAPDAPGDFAVQAGGDPDSGGEAGTAVLTWTAPWHNGRALQKYQLRYRSAADPAFADADWRDLPAGAEGHALAGLARGADYAFELRAVNAIGAGAPAQAAIDLTAPAPESTTIVKDGAYGGGIVLTLSEAYGRPLPDKAAFAVTVQGYEYDRPETRAVTKATPAVHADGAVRDILIEIEGRIRPAETVTLAYTPPAQDPLADAAGNPVAGFADYAVTNDLAAYRPDAPTRIGLVNDNEEAQISDTASQALLTWYLAWHNGSPITKYQWRRAGGHGAADGDYGGWADVPDDNIAGQLLAETYEWIVQGLTPGAPYSFQIRAVNAEGNGDPVTWEYRAADDRAPALSSAYVKSTARNILFLDFGEALDKARKPDKGAFAVTAAGRRFTPRGVIFDSDVDSQVLLELADADAIRPGEGVTVTYTVPANRKKRLQDPSGNQAAGFVTGAGGVPAVGNGLPAEAPEAPGNLAWRYDSNGDGTGTLTLTWETPWHNGSPLVRYQVRRQQDGPSERPRDLAETALTAPRSAWPPAFSTNATEGDDLDLPGEGGERNRRRRPWRRLPSPSPTKGRRRRRAQRSTRPTAGPCA